MSKVIIIFETTKFIFINHSCKVDLFLLYLWLAWVCSIIGNATVSKTVLHVSNRGSNPFTPATNTEDRVERLEV